MSWKSGELVLEDGSEWSAATPLTEWRADDGEVRHADALVAPSSMMDMRRQPVARRREPAHRTSPQEAPVDLVDDLAGAEGARGSKTARASARAPRAAACGWCSRRSRRSAQATSQAALLVDEQAHQLGDGDRRVGVVELDGDLLGEAPRARSGPSCSGGRCRGCEQATKKYSCRRRSSARLEVVVRVEDLRDDLGGVLGLRRRGRSRRR